MIPKKKWNTPIRILILCLVMLSVSCEQDHGVKNSQPNALKSSDYRYKMLEADGLDMTGATLVKDGILVEDDMVIPFAAFDPSKKNSSGKVGQYDIGASLLLTPQYGTFKVFVDENSFPDPIFREHIIFAVDDAITDYNGFCTFILMDRTINPAEASLVITNGYLDPGVYGRSVFPAGTGKVGASMTISEDNMASAGITSESGCRRVISHEMGHTLGLRHSDWNQTLTHTVRTGFWPFYSTVTIVDQAAEPQNPYDPTINQTIGAVLVPGTPASDPSSIMNRLKYQEAVVFNGFSDYDKLTLQTLYPRAIPCVPPCQLPYPNITSITIDGNPVQGSFSISPGSHFLAVQGAGNPPTISYAVMFGNITINSSNSGGCSFYYGGGAAGFNVTLTNSCYSNSQIISLH